MKNISDVLIYLQYYEMKMVDELEKCKMDVYAKSIFSIQRNKKWNRTTAWDMELKLKRHRHISMPVNWDTEAHASYFSLNS